MDDPKWEKIESAKCDVYFPVKDVVLKVGDSVEGRLVDIQNGIGQNNANLYILEDAAGLITTGVWGGTVLNGKLGKIAKGKMVKVVYLGERPSPKRPGKHYKDWEVYVGVDAPGDEANA